MSSTTPEPWEVQVEPTGELYTVPTYRLVHQIPGDHYGQSAAITLTEGNARRIVACVNACAGLSTEALETGVLSELLKQLRPDALGPAATLLDIVEAARAALAKLEATP